MKKWSVVVAITVIISLSIGLYIGNLLVPDLPVGTLAAGISGSIIGVTIVLLTISLRQRFKRNNVPEVDERTWINIKNFYAISLYIVLFGSMLLVCVLFAFEMRTIELGALSIYLLLLFMFLTIGTFIVSKR